MSEVPAYRRFFPYDQPFTGQAEAMERIYNALTRGQDVLFEGACGTGKTLAALAPALEHARQTDRTVIITTNVHQQTRQFRREAAAITEQTPIRAAVFRGKGSMCHIGVDYEECQLLRDATHDLVEAEQTREELKAREQTLLEQSQAGEEDAAAMRSEVLEELTAVEDEIETLRDESICDRYYRNLTEDTEPFYRWLFDDVRSPGDVYDRADTAGYCGYELLKDGLDDLDLVVCNYHHLLDPFIRQQFFKWLDVDPAETILVFDEAHNIPKAAREHATRTLTEQTLDRAITEATEAAGQQAQAALNVFRPFRQALKAAYEAELAVPGSIDDDWTDLDITNEAEQDGLTRRFYDSYSGPDIETDLTQARSFAQALTERYEAEYRDGTAETRREAAAQTVVEFLEAWLANASDPSYHPLVSVRRDNATGEVYGRAELYTLIPRAVTAGIFESAAASVLMSATLRPFAVTEDVLGLSETATMSFGLSFPPANRQTLAVATPPLFASDRDDPSVQATLTETLADTIRVTPGNTLLFFPSYGEASRYHDHLTDASDTRLFLDRPGEAATGLREQFTDADDAALLTSLWGTLTEGVSFDGDDARTVGVVGVPYPHLDDRRRAVQAAYEEAFADRPVADPGWQYAIEVPTVRKTRQAIGRVLRSPDDIGVRLLFDSRYTAAGREDLGKYSVHDSFPTDLREELVDVDPAKVKYSLLNFYRDHDLYSGRPPRP